jgi:hypothetical protein
MQVALELVVADAFANIISVQDCIGHSRSPFHTAQNWCGSLLESVQQGHPNRL